MQVSVDPQITKFLTQAAPYCLGLLCLFAIFAVVIPLTFRFSMAVEAITLLLEGLGDYFDNKALVWAGCLAMLSCVAGCCIITMISAVLFLRSSGSSALGCDVATTRSWLCGIIGK